MFLSLLLPLLSCGVGKVVALGPSTNLIIGNKIISPDGFTRAAVLAGFDALSLSFPGPLISGSKGDTFNINVENYLTDTTMLTSTSVHWHGIFQRRSSWADGVAGVSQCPITPNNSFAYHFSSLSQAGTFWYHSHYSTQYCDGLRGPMVIYDPTDPHRSKYDIDDETTVITLADWYHKTAHIIYTQGTVPKPDATLINGKGRYLGGPSSPLSVITVLPNKRYRFRLISMSCDPNYLFSIDGHDMTVIEVDGNNVQPLLVDSIQIFAGQRYSFVLDTTNTRVSNYWIRAQPSGVNKNFTSGGINSAILRYVGAPEEEPNTLSSPSNPLRETDLHPLEPSTVPGIPLVGAADVNLNLVTGFNASARRFTMNGATYDPPSVPVLLQILNGASPQDLLPSGDVYVLPPHKVIELSIPGGSIGSPHPFHLHGHAFDVIRSAGSSVYNYVDPVKRDVVSVGGLGDNVTIRFRTDNAGPWILHCHIDWHLEAGLAVVFAEDPSTIASSTQPKPWHDLCPMFQTAPAQTFN